MKISNDIKSNKINNISNSISISKKQSNCNKMGVCMSCCAQREKDEKMATMDLTLNSARSII
jgi:hypothetical protein